MKKMVSQKDAFFRCCIACVLLLISVYPFSSVCAAPTKPSCSDLGYNLTKANSWKCYDKYFICPLDANYIRCDKYAEVGDIKYSKSSTESLGWLLCDGTTYSPSKYPELYSVISTKFGGTSSAPKLPDYRGIILRGFGSKKITSGSITTTYSALGINQLQSSSCKYHNHSFTKYTYSYTTKQEGRYSGNSSVAVATSFVPIVSASGSGDYTCPYRIGLNAFIYAGQPATNN